MVVKKRRLLWDYHNTTQVPQAMDRVNFDGPLSSISNWNSWVPPELKGRAEYRPMVREESCLSGGDWTNVENTDQPIIHFFNEPERHGITAEHAADVWHQKMLPLRNDKGKKLVSPSCSNDNAGQAWIEDFMGRIQDAMPDYLGLHYYGDDGNAAQQFIEDMHGKWPEIPVIVSEIACVSRDGNAVVEFSKQLANWMDGQDFVFEYGFFGCMQTLADDFVSPCAQLMNPDGSWTPLMEMLQNEQPM